MWSFHGINLSSLFGWTFHVHILILCVYCFSCAWCTNLVMETGMSSRQHFAPHLCFGSIGLSSPEQFRNSLDAVIPLSVSWRKKTKNTTREKGRHGKIKNTLGYNSSYTSARVLISWIMQLLRSNNCFYFNAFSRHQQSGYQRHRLLRLLPWLPSKRENNHPWTITWAR